MCYSSKLRYQSPFLKMGFSIGLLFLCVISRSIVVSLCILLLMGSLTVIRGGTSFKRYRHFILVPLAFLLLSTVAIMVNLSPEPLSLVAIPVGQIILNRKLGRFHSMCEFDSYRPGRRVLSLFFNAYHTTHRYIISASEM